MRFATVMPVIMRGSLSEAIVSVIARTFYPHLINVLIIQATLDYITPNKSVKRDQIRIDLTPTLNKPQPSVAVAAPCLTIPSPNLSLSIPTPRLVSRFL